MDLSDVVYKSQREKFDAVVEEIRERHATGQPILVGTISIETSEMLSRKLQKFGAKHNVLNAKQHEREAEIVAQAGRKDAVTIATNMAGRGTDIVLGGNPEFLALAKCQHDKLHPEYPAMLARFEAECAAERAEVVAAGGLHIVGTERHESRRIDNQLRGRSGRQGDPGSSRFFLSLEDELMRIFGGERLQGWMERLGLQEGEAIEHRMVTRAIENAQKKVEARNFDMRKQVLDYDDVMNKQRTEIYSFRRELLEGGSQREYVVSRARDILGWLLEAHIPEEAEPKEWDVKGLLAEVRGYFGLDLSLADVGADEKSRAQMQQAVWERAIAKYDAKEARLGPDNMRVFERIIILRVLDTQWKDHLLALDHLKEGIGLRGYAQKDPKVEYKRESFEMLAEMKERIEDEVVRRLWLIEPVLQQEQQEVQKQRERMRRVVYGASQAAADKKTVQRKTARVGRNDPCPCGSGKKYKKCCGTAA